MHYLNLFFRKLGNNFFINSCYCLRLFSLWPSSEYLQVFSHFHSNYTSEKKQNRFEFKGFLTNNQPKNHVILCYSIYSVWFTYKRFKQSSLFLGDSSTLQKECTIYLSSSFSLHEILTACKIQLQFTHFWRITSEFTTNRFAFTNSNLQPLTTDRFSVLQLRVVKCKK